MSNFLKNNKKAILQLATIVGIVAFMLLISQDIAFADTFQGESQGRKYNLTKFWDATKGFYKLIVAIAIPCSAVSLAMGAFKLLTSSGDRAREAKAQIIMTLAAIACILLLPAFVTLGANIGQQYGWEPKVESADALKTKIDDDTKKRHENDDVDKDKDKDSSKDDDKKGADSK